MMLFNDFEDSILFSNHYFLIGHDEEAIRRFFSKSLRNLFEKDTKYFIEIVDNTILIYTTQKLANLSEIKNLILFAEKLIEIICREETHNTSDSFLPLQNGSAIK